MRNATAGRVVLTVNQFSEKHPAFTQGALRNMIFLSRPRKKSKGNGFAPAILCLGRRVLIDEQKFFECLDKIQPKV